MLPRVGSRSPVSSRKSVVFPVPFRPTMPQRWPASTVKVTSEKSLVAPKSTPTPAKAICVMWRQLNYPLHSTRAFLYVRPWGAAAHALAPALQTAGRQNALQPHGRLDDALLRDAGRARGGARAWMVSRDAARSPPRAEPSRVGARDGAGESRRDGERARSPGRVAAGNPRDRDRLLDLLFEKSARALDRRMPSNWSQRDRRTGIRSSRHDHRRPGRPRRPCHGALAASSHPEAMSLLDTPLTRQLGIRVPLICGAMYPCTNPELVAAVSAAGGIGVVQPLSMIYVYGHGLRAGFQLIRRITDKPIGMNVLIERSSKLYLDRMHRYLDVALEEGVRFFVTSLGNPRWVVDRVAAAGGIVYHDVTERKWAEKALAGGVHGLIAVNDRAGGHAGRLSAERLRDELGGLGVPLVCAGGIGDEAGFVAALRMGYAGAQLGTRFIATVECGAHDDYKEAIVAAGPEDIVLTERVTGVPL